MPRQNLKVIFGTLLIAAAAFVIGLKVALMRTGPASAGPPPRPAPEHRPSAAKASHPPAGRGPDGGQGATAALPDEASRALAASLDLITSPQSTFRQKWAAWEQLRKAGRMAEAVGTLKQMVDQNPNDATLITALGEAQINQVRDILEAGGDQNAVAILALQADQNFNAALTLDPTNWEAQFEKAITMSHWPATMNKGPEVIQRLTALVAQQEAATTSSPDYAQTYALLGEQYRAAGDAEKATQVWQQGLARFPLSPTLQHEFNHAPNP